MTSLTLPPAPLVMGVLNLNAGSLQTNSTHSIADAALNACEQMLADGAALIDVSCEYARNESKLSVQDEINILVPIVELVSARISIPISVDTSNPDVMQAAVSAGAKMINDTRALTKLSAMSTMAALKTHVCLMHMQNDPVNVQLRDADKDIVSIVYKYLEERIAACVAAGIDAKKIIIDPGFGFGKTLPQNLTLLRSLHMFKNLNCPVLVDISHKSMLGQILNVDVADRSYGSVAAEVVAISRGADIIRSHDVRATVDAIKVLKAIADI
ncbi:MAG TPA: dihydropteroate synthase [Gammaproteobacteria bacterium]|nr:dihydropteroate synthase [Gammaproteobacteria bacterium]